MRGRIGVSGNCSLGHRSLDYRFLMLHFPFAPQKTEENMFAREKRGTGKEAKEKEKRERNVEGMFRANKGKGVKEEEKVAGTGWLQKDKGEKRWKNRDGKRRRASRKERGKGRRWGAKGRGGRSGWSRLEMERRRSESEWNRLDRAKERTVWWPWTINATGSFCRFLFSRRIPSNAHTVQYVRPERSDHVDWISGGEGRLAWTFRGAFLLLFPCRGCRFGDSCRHTALRRWNVGERPTRGANIFPFYLTVLDTPRDAPLLAPLLPIVSTLERERDTWPVSTKPCSLRDKETKIRY